MDISAGPIGLIIDDLTGGRLKTFENYNVVRLLSEGRYAEAILFVSNNSDSPFNFIEETLLGIDTRVSSRITYTGSTQLPTLSKIGENDNKWEGANTSTWKDPDQGSTAYPNSPPPGTFTVTSESQANSIFQNPNSTAVERAAAQGFYRSGAVTSTNVPTGITVTSESQANSILQNPNATETERQAAREYYGAASAPASDGAYKFSRVGGVEELEAEFRSGHNKYSIGVAFVGGYTVNSNSGLANPPYGVESINSEQVKALRRFMSTFYKVWPGGQAWGHNDTDPQRKPDPGFSVPQFVRSNFGKENASLSGTTPPLTPEEIAAQRREGS